ncbi:hypothetical protein A1O1_03290 [Capronia coronata CBS 617.96]|uniref:NmrA-like domain-containing protein n=1 Tax=Capronia coronata CBS 617.96 TaxID=1182541 RepID=W9YLR7_9EURO|nr:uncharacterized protein A1O1_03290 [Capronia coronata CBS 617.96]EXJ90191.1 hypothetical protein A1O1_03290 [Capronia coronata CBS 617.96]
MSPKLIVVVGATGTQGGSVVDTFLKDPEWKVRGLTRNTSSASAEKLRTRGVEVVSANLGDPSSLVAAFAGADAIFSVTDFWGAFLDPANSSKPAPGQALVEWVYEYELQQGKNVLDAASQIPDLQRLVFSSLAHVSKWSRGKYTHVYHYDSKAMAVEYGRAAHPELWKKTSIIQLGYYLTNFLRMPQLVQITKDKEGVYNLASRLNPKTKLPMIATDEDTGLFVKALVDTEPGKNLITYREWMSLEEFIKVWSKVLGVKAKNVPFPDDFAWEGTPIELKRAIIEILAFCDEFGYQARDDPSVNHPKDLGIELKLGTVEEWIKKQDWSRFL